MENLGEILGEIGEASVQIHFCDIGYLDGGIYECMEVIGLRGQMVKQSNSKFEAWERTL